MNKRLLFYLGSSAIIVVFLFLWILGRSGSSEQQRIVSPNTQTQAATVDTERDVTLYFASPDASQLINLTSRINCSDERDCLRKIIEALIKGPVADGLPVVSARASLNNVRIEEDMAILDFDAQFTEGHPGGSQSELLTVYALANSVAVNFPHLRQIQIIIDGAEVDTLKGHVDLRRPLLADFSYSRRSINVVEKED
jgi:spore germination protein GerM